MSDDELFSGCDNVLDATREALRIIFFVKDKFQEGYREGQNADLFFLDKGKQFFYVTSHLIRDEIELSPGKQRRENLLVANIKAACGILQYFFMKLDVGFGKRKVHQICHVFMLKHDAFWFPCRS
ncbi:hypothetical protein BBR01nite_01120 [Brevibacillus brevis]|nr:hypothetical protein BBR01nite_01120 [Brevibacillus brevis]